MWNYTENFHKYFHGIRIQRMHIYPTKPTPRHATTHELVRCNACNTYIVAKSLPLCPALHAMPSSPHVIHQARDAPASAITNFSGVRSAVTLYSAR